MVRVGHHSELDDHNDVCQCYKPFIRTNGGPRKEKGVLQNTVIPICHRRLRLEELSGVKNNDKHNVIHNLSSRPLEQRKAYHHSEHIVSYSGCYHSQNKIIVICVK